MYENSTEEIIKAQNNEEGAMNNIVIKNSGLIWSIVKRFCGRGYDACLLYTSNNLEIHKVNNKTNIPKKITLIQAEDPHVSIIFLVIFKIT